MSLHSCADTLTGSCCRCIGCTERFEASPQFEMPLTRVLDQRPPDCRGESMADQQSPEAVRSLVEVAHREIGEHCAAVARPPLPDRRVREQAVVAPRVATIELVTAHVLRLEHDVRGVVL